MKSYAQNIHAAWGSLVRKRLGRLGGFGQFQRRIKDSKRRQLRKLCLLMVKAGGVDAVFPKP